MIDLYTFGTPNGRKVSIALEEMGLAYQTHVINITRDEQFNPAFLKIAPNNKIPVIVDHETNVTMMESGSILYYLATKSQQFMPTVPHWHWEAIEWLNWQMGGFGPMLGQANHFLHFNPGKSEYAEQRYAMEARRLYEVLDKRLEDRAYVANEYSIADMAIFPWVARWSWQNIDMGTLPNIKRWYYAIASRPAVKRGYNVPTEAEIPLP
ncbi:glutathione S-transferase N-terminal domain-containing protein [Pseudahrensia aquimaris]|uniref:Glutathione S-transferase N-terminal domain-containing protein n=1 Tax=Pseudahrensia aquimaris TaxID=744461 RepID=A0ABW3FHE3_9HYPH